MAKKVFDVQVSPSVSRSEYIFCYVMDKKAVYQIWSSEHIKTSLILVSHTKKYLLFSFQVASET